MNISSVSFSPALTAALTGYNRSSGQMANLMKSIATGDGDLVENIVELSSAETQAQASLQVLGKSLDFSQSTIDILV